MPPRRAASTKPPPLRAPFRNRRRLPNRRRDARPPTSKSIASSHFTHGHPPFNCCRHPNLSEAVVPSGRQTLCCSRAGRHRGAQADPCRIVLDPSDHPAPREGCLQDLRRSIRPAAAEPCSLWPNGAPIGRILHELEGTRQWSDALLRKLGGHLIRYYKFQL
jgi:hypothetical protein